MMGQEGDLTSVEHACETLVNEVERLQTPLAVFLQENSREQS